MAVKLLSPTCVGVY